MIAESGADKTLWSRVRLACGQEVPLASRLRGWYF